MRHPKQACKCSRKQVARPLSDALSHVELVITYFSSFTHTLSGISLLQNCSGRHKMQLLLCSCCSLRVCVSACVRVCVCERERHTVAGGHAFPL